MLHRLPKFFFLFFFSSSRGCFLQRAAKEEEAQEKFWMSSISPRSFGDALRRAYSSFPQILLPRSSLVVRGKTDIAATHAVPHMYGGVDSHEGRQMADPVFVPLVRRPFYACTGEAKDALVEFTQKHGYKSPLFVPCCLSLAPHARNDIEAPFSASVDGNSHDGTTKATSNSAIAAVPSQTPTVNIRLFRCESRVNLTDCLRTRLLQEELRRTENELFLLHKHARVSASVAGFDVKPLGVAFPPEVEAQQSLPSHHLQLRWQKHGWYFEDATLAAEQSRCVPFPAGSVGYWGAWVTPHVDSFVNLSVLRLQDIHHFLLEYQVTLINVETVCHYLANDNKTLFPLRSMPASVDYWASTGEPFSATGTSVATPRLVDNSEVHRSFFPPQSTCWFAVTELPERRLQIRRGGEVVQLSVSYNGCGFFLHEAPRWFLMPREAVVQKCPLSYATLRGILSSPEFGSKSDVLAALEGSGLLRDEIVFVLQETSTWHMYPRRQSVLNFSQSFLKEEELSRCDDDSCMNSSRALIFIDINEAVRLMRDWSRQQQQQRGPDTTNKRQSKERERIINFFASIPSPLSAAAFITSFIDHCACTLEFVLPSPPLDPALKHSDSTTELASEEMATMTLNDHDELKSVSQIYEQPQATTCRKETTRDPNNDNDNYHNADDDCLKVGRHVYKSGRRLDEVCIHPQHVPHLTTALAKDIIAARAENKRREFLSPMKNEFVFTESKNCDEEMTVVWDLGIVWASFAYTIPAVNAFDTEIISE
ncbi:hypothetical protein MOQ_004908 [Trypanosoma cruzi marinkellei]|uniref:Uncharacterized protein n=1 Tax=Trypanosoma cruzi marinkellei TaxID=85056 RepID=K2MZR1_TRYCR|nr:hypothetical protein MOQ_004908 [Trypanosoma cruzi marinkellei]